ncbi:unnamed protein product [Mytilus edulis]|uniref:Uncharacterized protein n=1 Tax=Mytilus edulis TaxID=6550 RepID=A0A8S3QQ96_MYTED|nr:unnamed protein product [Mytilus edulis]
MDELSTRNVWPAATAGFTFPVDFSQQQHLICPEDDNLVKKDLKFLKWYDAEKLNFYKYSEEAVQLDSVSEVEKNDLRSKSPFHGDKVVYTVPVNFFMDDTSSNVSKRWSPLHCIQMQLAGIPVSERQLADNIKFISASTDVAILEMMKPVVDELIEIKRIGIDAFDAYNKEVVKVTSDLGLCVCDYSMLAEASNHMGANTNKFCPRCHAEKASGDFRKGLERTPAESSRILQRLSVNDRKDVRQQYGLKPYPNCLWDVINPHSDIPVGLLHWMFLGLGKHLLKACIQDLNEDQQQKLQLLLESMDQSSFTVKLSPDIVKHIDSRQGKDIKQYIQIAPYHMKLARLPVNKVKLLCRLAEICKMVVDKTDFACQDIEVIDNLIEEYLISLKEVYPSLMSKVKSHLSSHVVEDIESHGPLLAYTEDGFEKTHGRIRGQIFQQNQHARSRDTAHSFMEMEVLNHIISGGYFLNKEEEWVQASSDVRTLSTSKEIKSFLGQKTDGAELLTATLIKAERSLNRKVVKKDLTDDIKNTASLYTTNTGLIMTSYHGIKCKNGEVINQGNPVYCQDENDSAKKYIGLFNEGYHIKGEQERFQLVKIQLFEILPTDERMGFQAIKLKLSNNFKFTKVENVLQTLCIIHDCLSGGCHKKECVQTIRVEQEKTDVKKLVWYHSPLNKNYYLNRFRFSHDVKIC